jgi:hypothetical protein
MALPAELTQDSFMAALASFGRPYGLMTLSAELTQDSFTLSQP